MDGLSTLFVAFLDSMLLVRNFRHTGSILLQVTNRGSVCIARTLVKQSIDVMKENGVEEVCIMTALLYA